MIFIVLVIISQTITARIPVNLSDGIGHFIDTLSRRTDLIQCVLNYLFLLTVLLYNHTDHLFLGKFQLLFLRGFDISVHDIRVRNVLRLCRFHFLLRTEIFHFQIWRQNLKQTENHNHDPDPE